MADKVEQLEREVSNLKLAENKEQDQKTEACIPIGDVPRDMIKHPLQNSWTLWEHLNVRTKSWEENLVEIFSIETVEDFWTMVNHITPASKLKIGTGYLLFKKGIPPMWEHPANKNGGRWFVSFEKKKRRLELDNCWLEVMQMLCKIGEGAEAFGEYSDEVNGAVLNLTPKGDKIGIWTADSTRTTCIMEIGKRIMSSLLGATTNVPIKYQRLCDLNERPENRNLYQL